MKLRTVIFLGMIWGVLVVGFQWVAGNRFQAQSPDQALFWTPGETSPGILILLAFLIFALFAFLPSSTAETGTLTIEVSGLEKHHR